MSKNQEEICIQRELKTVEAMIRLFCRGRHQTTGDLCASCESLWRYAQERVSRCPFRGHKRTCRNCTVHCFAKDKREQIREVMRYAGPRMLWRHPVFTWFHMLSGRKSVETNNKR